MYSNTTDGSSDNEAVKIANAFKPFWKKWMKEWGRNCVRSKKMTVTTAPSILTGLVGVTDAFSDTECMIPFQMNVANAQVGDTVWVKWMYDNQQTMYAENMGNIRSEKVILSGIKNAEPVPSGGSVSYNVPFEKPFKETPVVVASMISPHSVETGLCSVRIWDVSPFAFTVGYQNGSQYSRNIGASWIATGELLNNPIQYTTDTTPYLNRAIPYSSNYLNLNKVIGGTVCWNQLTQIRNVPSNGITASFADGEFTLSGTANAGYAVVFLPQQTVKDHIYLSTVTVTANPNNVSFYASLLNVGWSKGKNMCKASQSVNSNNGINVTKGVDYTGVKFKYNLHDLTQMFGSTIADYIYSLERATAGAGMAWFRNLFPKNYYAYNAGELLSVKTSAHKTIGFNQWDEEWELGKIDTNGMNAADNTRIRSKNFIRVLPSVVYYFFNMAGSSNGHYVTLFFYDANRNYISRLSSSHTNFTFTIPSNCTYVRFSVLSWYGTTYNHDICINIHGDRDGEYEAYQSWNYTLDSNLELRGLPKLDANNKLYYDGDEYESDGTVTRNYAIRAYQSGDESLTDAITDGTNTVYKLSTPTTESATAYTKAQTCDPNGTEEFIDGRTVEMPVGNETQYIVM